MASLDEEGSRVFANTLWEIWKERNKSVIEHCTFQPQAVIKRVQAAMTATALEGTASFTTAQRVESVGYEYRSDGWQVIVDASWDTSLQSGGAYIVYEKGILHSVGMHSFTAHDPFQAEAWTLREAMRFMYSRLGCLDESPIDFYSDCLNLVVAVNQGDSEDLPSWRTISLVNDLITEMELRQNGAVLTHVSREALHPAHSLANLARRQHIQYQGRPNLVIQQQNKLPPTVDPKFFQRVQQQPP